MIVRVLRPVTGSKGRAGTPGEETAPKLEPLVDEAADANAIEVCQAFRKECLQKKNHMLWVLKRTVSMRRFF